MRCREAIFVDESTFDFPIFLLFFNTKFPIFPIFSIPSFLCSHIFGGGAGGQFPRNNDPYRIKIFIYARACVNKMTYAVAYKIQEARVALLSCSPNFPRASITRYTHAKHEQILN